MGDNSTKKAVQDIEAVQDTPAAQDIQAVQHAQSGRYLGQSISRRLVAMLLLVAVLLFAGGLWALSGPLAHSELFQTTLSSDTTFTHDNQSNTSDAKAQPKAASVQDTKQTEPATQSESAQENNSGHTEKPATTPASENTADEASAAEVPESQASGEAVPAEEVIECIEVPLEQPQAVTSAPATPSASSNDASYTQPTNVSSATVAQGSQTHGTQPQGSAQASAGTQSTANNSQPPSAPEPEPVTTPVVPATVTVVVTVDGSPAGFPITSTNVTLEQGATVYDALLASGANVNARQTAYGIYVAAIAGLAEREFGAQSGWMYAVNGVYPNASCSNYVVSDNDSILWAYVNAEV